MGSTREKITFYITGFFYLVFHLRYSHGAGFLLKETLLQLLATMPYVAALTYIVVFFIRHVSGGTWPPWDRVVRIFFTFGIIAGFLFSLYEYASSGQDQLLLG